MIAFDGFAQVVKRIVQALGNAAESLGVGRPQHNDVFGTGGLFELGNVLAYLPDLFRLGAFNHIVGTVCLTTFKLQVRYLLDYNFPTRIFSSKYRVGETIIALNKKIKPQRLEHHLYLKLCLLFVVKH